MIHLFLFHLFRSVVLLVYSLQPTHRADVYVFIGRPTKDLININLFLLSRSSSKSDSRIFAVVIVRQCLNNVAKDSGARMYELIACVRLPRAKSQFGESTRMESSGIINNYEVIRTN